MNTVKLFLICCLMVAAGAEAVVVNAEKNGRWAYEDGLQVNLNGACYNNVGAAEIYETVDSVACYKQSYDLAVTSWSVTGYGMIPPSADDPCELITWDSRTNRSH